MGWIVIFLFSSFGGMLLAASTGYTLAEKWGAFFLGTVLSFMGIVVLISFIVKKDDDYR